MLPRVTRGALDTSRVMQLLAITGSIRHASSTAAVVRAAARLAPPGVDRPWRPEAPDPGEVRNPTLIVAGADDYLRESGYADQLAAELQEGRAE